MPRSLLAASAALAVVGLAACGSTTAPLAAPPAPRPSSTVPAPTTAPRPAPTTTATAPAPQAAPPTTVAPTTVRPPQPPAAAPAAAPARAPQRFAPAPPPAAQPAAQPAARAASGCNANYDPCVPDDPDDVDCRGGSGNGPSYVAGPVRVVGNDVYGLDRDGDGDACE